MSAVHSTILLPLLDNKVWQLALNDHSAQRLKYDYTTCFFASVEIFPPLSHFRTEYLTEVVAVEAVVAAHAPVVNYKYLGSARNKESAAAALPVASVVTEFAFQISLCLLT